MTQDLAAALTDVRRAYRLLWAYQKRVIQCATFIRDRLGFVHAYVDYQFSTPKNDIEHRWAWDGLPFALTGFVSTRTESKRPSDGMILYVHIVSDTGLRDCFYSGDYSDEPDANRFVPPESCQSQLRLSLVVANAHIMGKTEAKNIVNQINNNEKGWPDHDQIIDYDELEIKLYGHFIDMAEIGDQDALAQRTDAFSARVKDTLSITLL